MACHRISTPRTLIKPVIVSLLNTLFQGFPFVIHHINKELPTGGLVNFVNVADVRVVQSGGSLSFARILWWDIVLPITFEPPCLVAVSRFRRPTAVGVLFEDLVGLVAERLGAVQIRLQRFSTTTLTHHVDQRNPPDNHVFFVVDLAVR